MYCTIPEFALKMAEFGDAIYLEDVYCKLNVCDDYVLRGLDILNNVHVA